MASVVFSKAEVETMILALLDFSPDTPDTVKRFLVARKLEVALGSLGEYPTDMDRISFGIVPDGDGGGDGDEGVAGNGVEGGDKGGVVPGGGGAGGAGGAGQQCSRGGASTRAANEGREWNLEDRYLEQEDIMSQDIYGEDQPPPNCSGPTYSMASTIGVAEEPPQDVNIRQFILAVCKHARACLDKNPSSLPWTSPETLLKAITGETDIVGVYQTAQLGTHTNNSIESIVSMAKVCMATDTLDALLQLNSWLNCIKFASLVERGVFFGCMEIIKV
jgi:hypothetical protein